MSFLYPRDAGKRVALCRLLMAQFDNHLSNRLVWITNHCVWESGQHLPLAETARSSWGATRAIHEQPGHLLSVNDKEDGLSLVVLTCLFLWDGWVISADAKIALKFSHDEFGRLYDDEEQLEEFAARL